jgi:hypothetical protein
MTGNPRMFTSLDENVDEQDKITFGDNSKGKGQGLGKVAISNDLSISNVPLVATLSFNLLLVGQLCDLGLCSIPKIQILKFSQTRSKFKMNFKFHFKMFVCELISTNKV